MVEGNVAAGTGRREKRMNIEKKLEEGVVTLRVSGRLDTNTAPELEAELPKDGNGVREIVFDLEPLEYISSAGLRVLLMAQRRVMAGGGSVAIANPNGVVRDVLDMTGCSDIFEIR